jgi:hypothetical protein
MAEPPQAEGATGTGGMVLMTPLHPPLAEVVSSHEAKDASMAAWSWHAASVLSVPHVNMMAGAGFTVKILVHVCRGPQVLV